MSLSAIKSTGATCDALGRYVASVQKLNSQIHRIVADKSEIASSLSRAAAALRSISSARHTQASNLTASRNN